MRALGRGWLAAMLCGPCIAWAQFGVSLAAESDYRYRGVSLSSGKPGLRLTVNDDAGAGWYAGASAASVERADGERYTQWLAYAGRVLPAGDGRGLDIGLIHSRITGGAGLNFTEAYLGLAGQRWSLRAHYAPSYFGRHVRTLYVDAGANWMLSDRARLFGHVGMLSALSTRYGPQPRTRVDARCGAGWTVGDADLQLAWVAASRGGPYPVARADRRGEWVLGVSYSF